MPMLTGYTPEGLGYAVRRSGAEVGYCALTIGCGTRDEHPFPSGIAHFTEHSVFKGTARRSARSINSCLEILGGELNAFTTKEEIVIHATVLKEDLGRALGLLVELATEPSFPSTEIEVEKGVVMDEIQAYKDSPSEDIYDCFEELLFKGHPLSSPILGTIESVPLITTEHLRAFTARGFVPGRMVLSMVADLPEEKMVRMIMKASSAVKSVPGAQETAKPVREHISPEQRQFNQSVNKDNHEANAVFGGYAPSLGEGRERLVAGLLANILGGPASNSILGNVLREKNGWVYGVEASYTPYLDSGIMAISFGCDHSNLSKATRAMKRELVKICESPLGSRSFATAKKQLLGQMTVSNANGESQCLGIGKSMLAFGKVTSDEEMRQKIMSIEAEELRREAEKIFAPEKLSSLIFL